MTPLLVRVMMALAGTAVGGWMVFDGVHVMVKGKYFGPEKPGPWSGLVGWVGVDPFKLGPVFVVIGGLWLVFLVATLGGRGWGWYGAVAVAVGSLWYFPMGMVLSVVYLALLLFGEVPRVASS